MRAGERATVSVDATNTGGRAGDEVVQLYVHDRLASVTRPVQELRGFERTTLAPGERRTVSFVLGRSELAFLDRSMRRVVEPGLFDVRVGSSSADVRASAVLEVVE
jgi:beta-glucosidase